MKQKILLSQCMIVKDEAENIEKALSWGKGIVSEQIVVDTGSTDETVEIAKKMGAKVYSFPWTNDFAAAKNYAIEQATGNWIAFLDADEYFEEADAKAVFRLILQIEKKFSAKDRPHVISNKIVHLNDEGKVFSYSVQDRIFRNVPGLRYKNRIHEALFLNGGNHFVKMDAQEVAKIIHTGYAATTVDKKKKRERNIELLENELKDNPKDYVVMSYLGDVYMSACDYDKAEQLFEAVADHIEEVTNKDRVKAVFFALMQIVVQRNDSREEERLLQIYKNGKRKLPHDSDMDYWMGMWRVNQENWGEARIYLELSIQEQEQKQQFGSSYVLGKLVEVYYLLTMACQRLEDRPGMVKYAVLSLQRDKYIEDLLKLLMGLFMEESVSEENAQQIHKLLRQLYDLKNNIKDKLFVYKIAKQVRFSALCDLVYSSFTPEEKAWLNS